MRFRVNFVRPHLLEQRVVLGLAHNRGGAGFLCLHLLIARPLDELPLRLNALLGPFDRLL